MSKLDISWFDLKKYESLRGMSFVHLYRQIHIRQFLYNTLFDDLNISDNSTDDIRFWIERIKINPILPFYDYGSMVQPTVRPLTAFEIYIMTQEDRLSHIWKECEEQMDSFELGEDLDAHNSVDKLMYDAYGDDRCFFHLSVDLDATNEQIINDFTHWLLESRQEYKRNAPNDSPYKNSTKKKKKYSEKDLQGWVNLRLIQYLDLKIIPKFEKGTLTDAEAGELLHSDMSGYTKGARTNRTVRKQALHMISTETVRALAAQLRIAS